MTEIEERVEKAYRRWRNDPHLTFEKVYADAMREAVNDAFEKAAEELTKMSELAAYNQESRTTEAAYALGARAIRALKSSDPAKE